MKTKSKKCYAIQNDGEYLVRAFRYATDREKWIAQWRDIRATINRSCLRLPRCDSGECQVLGGNVWQNAIYRDC